VIGLADVMLQLTGKILSDHENLTKVGIDRIRDGNIDQAVAAPIRNSRFRVVDGKRMKARPLPPGENDCGDLDGLRHLRRSIESAGFFHNLVAF
jgi:hypothetical protein